MDIYRTISFGPSVGQGVNHSLFLHLSAVGKASSPGAPFVVANELLAAHLGHFLMLPVPPGAVVAHPNGTPYYASMDFNLTGNTLPPVIPQQFTAAFGGVAVASVLAFDILIANSDRHAHNLSALYQGPDSRYNIFDHSHCLWAGAPHAQIGATRLGAVTGCLVIDGALGGNRHCLCGELSDDRDFDSILNRVAALPDFYISESVNATRDYGVDGPNAAAMVDFLRQRRDTLPDLIAANRAAFPSVQQWRLL